MPITVTGPNPPGIGQGPGAAFFVSSDRIVDPTDTVEWEVVGRNPSPNGQIFWIGHYPYQIPTTKVILMDRPSDNISSQVWYPSDDVSVATDFILVVNGVAAEQTAFVALWNNTTWIGQQIAERQQAAGSAGFTDSDRQLLTQTEVRSQVLGEPTDLIVQHASGPQQLTIGQLFSRTALDTLTLVEATQGPTTEPVRVQFGLWYYGVIVRVTQIADDLVPRTPDDQWYFPDLAVLRIIRGVDLESRHGIHTPTAIFAHPWETGNFFRNTLDALGVPPDRTLAVDWRAGCGGQVFFQRFP